MNNITRPKQMQRSDPAADMATALLTNFAASSQRCMDWNAEVARFMTTRMTRDAETVQAAIGCGDGLKLAEIQQAWVTQTVEDYVQEAQRLMQMSSDIVTGLFASAEQTAPRTSVEGS
jgi:urease accessory protein UreF